MENLRCISKQYNLNVRPFYKGCAANPEILAANGETITLEYGWLMDEDDKYPGEVALIAPHSCRDLLERFGTTWIASGDVEEIK